MHTHAALDQLRHSSTLKCKNDNLYNGSITHITVNVCCLLSLFPISYIDAQQWKPAKLAPIGGQQPSANAGVTVGRTDWAAK